MLKKKSIGIIFLVILLASIATYYYWRAQVRDAMEYLARETPPYQDMSGKVLGDTYIIYNTDKNEENGTRDRNYYPCPTGYECKELLSSKLGFSVDQLTFDHCDGGVGCMDVLKDLLKKSGIEDVEAYIQERRLKSEESTY